CRRSTPPRSPRATRTTAVPASAPSTTRATTARSSSTPTGTTSRSSTTTCARPGRKHAPLRERPVRQSGRATLPSRARGRGSGAAVVACLLLRGTLGGRNDLEALVRDRLAALDREPVCPFEEALLGPLDGLELGAEAVDQRLVELGIVGARRLVGGVG